MEGGMGGWEGGVARLSYLNLPTYLSIHLPIYPPRAIAISSSANLPATSLPLCQLPTTYLPTTYLPTTDLPTTYLPTTYLPTPYLPTPYLPATHLPTSSHRSSSPKIRLAMVWFTLILSRCRSAAVRPG